MAINGKAPSAFRLPTDGPIAQNPPQFFRNRHRRPTTQDWQNFNLGCFWEYAPVNSTNSGQEVWQLVSLEGNQGKWVLVTSGNGSLVSLTGDVGGAVPPTNGNIDTIGGASTGNPTSNINTRGTPGTSTMEFCLNNSIYQPATTADGLNGVYGLGGVRFMHGFNGTSNAFVGTFAGNLTLTGTSDTGMGQGALFSLTTGSSNTALGDNALLNATTGSNNIAIGVQGGSAYTTESSNILIGNIGTAADANTMRLGTDGVGAGQIDAAYAAGIYNRTIGATNAVVYIDNTGKLGTGSIIRSAFEAYLNADILNQTGNGANIDVIYDVTTYDLNNDLNTVTGIFTAPVNGVYQFNASVRIGNITAAMTAGICSFIVVSAGANNGVWNFKRNNPAASMDPINNLYTYNGSISYNLNAGDTVNVRVRLENGAGDTASINGAPGGGAGGAVTYFTGFLSIKL